MSILRTRSGVFGGPPRLLLRIGYTPWSDKELTHLDLEKKPNNLDGVFDFLRNSKFPRNYGRRRIGIVAV